MTIKEAVNEVLTLYPKARDDDNYLYIEVARLLDKMWEYGNILALLNAVDYKTVERERRRLQRLYPDLRWEKYQARHKLAEKKRKEYSPSFWDKIQLIFG